MSNFSSENRVRLNPAVYSLLEEASRLTGKSMRDLASESVRNYLEDNLLLRKSSPKLVKKNEGLAFWDKQIEQVESQLSDLRLHKRMMEMMKPSLGRNSGNRRKA